MVLRHALLATLAAAALATLTACGGQTTETSTAPPAAPGAAQEEGGDEPIGDAPKPCVALTAEEVSGIIGAQVTEARPSEILGNHVCSYEAGLEDAIVTSQVSPLRGSLDANAKAALGPVGVRSTSPVEVPGTREALLGEGSASGVPMAGVVMNKDGHLFLVIVGDQDAAKAQDIAVQAAAAMAS